MMSNVWWILWDIFFISGIISAGATMMHKNKTLSSFGWYSGLGLVIVSAITLLYMLQIGLGLNILSPNTPFQYLQIAEAVGQYFLDILKFFRVPLPS